MQGQLKSLPRQTRRSSRNTVPSPGADRKAAVMADQPLSPAKKLARMMREHRLKESANADTAILTKTPGKNGKNTTKQDTRRVRDPNITNSSTRKEPKNVKKPSKHVPDVSNRAPTAEATKIIKNIGNETSGKKHATNATSKGRTNLGSGSGKKRSKHDDTGVDGKRPKKDKVANGQLSSTRDKPQPEQKPSASSSAKKHRPKKPRSRPERSAPDAAASGDIAALLRLGEGAAAEEPMSDDSDWEAVDAHASDLATKGFVEVTLPSDVAIKKKKKKGFDVEAYMKRQLSRARRELQQLLHRAHLLCLLSRALQLNALLNSETPLACAMSMLPSKYAYPPKRVALSYVSSFLKWFREKVPLEPPAEGGRPSEDVFRTLELRLRTKKAHTPLELVCLFVLILRAIGVDCRLVMSLQPVPLKPGQPPSDAAAGKTASAAGKAGKSSAKAKQPSKEIKKKAKPSDTGKKAAPAAGPSKPKPTTPSRTGSDRKAKRRPSAAAEAADSDSSSGDEFAPRRVQSSPRDRRVLSSSPEPSGAGRPGRADCWAEVYVEEELKWISVDVVGGGVQCVTQIRKRATAPLTYVLGCDNAGHVKDLTARYDPRWHSSTRRLRVEADWWSAATGAWRGAADRRDREEDEELERELQERPMPQSIAEFKDHPLYALERHLLKFEAIYPPSAVPLGYIGKGERRCPVYARECVRTLHARETWIKQARVVKEGEEPYKIVKARPKWDKLLQKVITDKPLAVFGRWQTAEYVPPRAEGGKVPRNDYGNVELFKPSMLPGGTVHLNVEGLSRVAKRLGIDCAPAMVGWDFHCGGSHPVFEGYVVCEEFEDTLMDAWEADQREARRRQREKRLKRIHDNWRRLVRGLLIRQRLARKYDFKDAPPAGSKRPAGVDRAGKRARGATERREPKAEPGPLEPGMPNLEPAVKTEPVSERAAVKQGGKAQPKLAAKLSARMKATQADKTPKPELKPEPKEAGSEDEEVPETQEERAKRVEASMAGMGLRRVALSSDSEAESDAESSGKTGNKTGPMFGAAVMAKLSPAAAGGSKNPTPPAAQRKRRSAPASSRRARKASPVSRSPSPLPPGAGTGAVRPARRRSARTVTVDYREAGGSGSEGEAPLREEDLTSDEEQPFVKAAAAASSDDDDDFMGF